MLLRRMANKSSLAILFQEIWDENPHVSVISGELLLPPDHPKWHWQFSHVLSRQAFPRYRNEKKNILLMLPDEHQLLTEHPEKTKQLPEWQAYWELYESLRRGYFM